MRQMSFRRRQFLTLLALAIIPLTLATSLGLGSSQNSAGRRTAAQLEAVADLKAVQVEQWLNQGREAALLVASLHEVREELLLFLAPPDAEAFAYAQTDLYNDLQPVIATFPHVRAVSLLHPASGQVMLSTDLVQEGRERRNEAYFRAGQQALYVSPVAYSVGRESPVLIISAPVRDAGGELLAVAAIEMNLADLDAAISNHAGLSQGSHIHLLDSYGFSIIQPPDAEGGPLRTLIESEGARRALAGENGHDAYRDEQGVLMLGVYRWLPGANLGLLVEMEQAELTGEIRRLWALIILFNIPLFVLAVVAARYLSNWLVTPLERIAGAARALQAGDLSQRAPPGDGDEIGQLSLAFNEMADSLQRSHENLEQLVQERTAELKQTEARLEGIVQTAPDAIISVDETQRILMFNQAAEVMFGCAASEVIGQHINLFIPERYHQAHIEHVNAFTRSTGRPREKNIGRELVARRLDGSKFPIEASISRVEVGGQRILTVILRDITERRRAEAALRRRFEQLQTIYRLSATVGQVGAIEEIYQKAMDALQHALKTDRASVLLFDSHGVMRFVAWRKLSETYRQAVEGHSPWTPEEENAQPILMPDAKDEPGLGALRNVILDEGIRALAFVPLAYQGRLLGKFMLYYNAPHPFSEDEVQLAQTIASHVAFALERKRAEEALQESEERYRQLVENASDIIYGADENGFLTFVNHVTVDITGYSEDELIGKHYLEFTRPDSRRDARRFYRRQFAKKIPTTYYELPIVSKDGTELWLGQNVQLALAGEQIMGFRTIARDITGRRRAQADLEKSYQAQNVLNTLLQTASLPMSMEALLERALDTILAVPFMQLDPRAGIFLVEPRPGRDEEQVLTLKAARGLPDTLRTMCARVPFGRCLCGRAAASRQVQFADCVDHRHENRYEGIVPHGHYNVPILSKGKVLGVIMLYLQEGHRRKKQEDLLLQAVANTMAGIIERKWAEAQIRASLREKEVLLKEIHHRVKNNLQVVSSLLRLQSQHIAGEQAQALFKESQHRVKTMALIHEKLYQAKDLARIDFARYSRNLTSYLLRSYGIDPERISLVINASDVFLGVDTAVPCGLIVNELVSNALKHAFPPGQAGEIRIDLYTDYDHQLTLVVSDNGVGLPETLDLQNSESLGLQLVGMLADQLEGTIEIDRSQGTAFKIVFSP